MSYRLRRFEPDIYNLACYLLIVPFFLIFSSELLNTPSGPQLMLEGKSFHTLRYDLTVWECMTSGCEEVSDMEGKWGDKYSQTMMKNP